jgi:DNA-binding PadR family transcriptional regulator
MNDLLVLSMMLNAPKHGYQLKHEAGMIFGQEVLHNNLIYPMLRRFLNDGWVSKKEVPGERGQTRLQYALTAQGRRALLERLSQFTDADAASDEEFRSRVGLFELLQPEARENILTRREIYLQRLDQRLASLENNVKLGKYGAQAIVELREHIALDSKWIQHLRRLSKSDQREPLPAVPRRSTKM